MGQATIAQFLHPVKPSCLLPSVCHRRGWTWSTGGQEGPASVVEIEICETLSGSLVKIGVRAGHLVLQHSVGAHSLPLSANVFQD